MNEYEEEIRDKVLEQLMDVVYENCDDYLSIDELVECIDIVKGNA